MVDFRDKKRVETREASIKVDAGLPAGRYVFQLTVVDSSGNRSEPRRINIEIVRGLAITDPRLVRPTSPSLIDAVTEVSPVRVID